MTQIEPDSVMGRTIHPEEGETVLETFRADRLTYWKSHLIMAVVLGTAAGLFLMCQGNPFPVAGPIGAILAIGARAAYLASEALSDSWALTERRLLGPGGRIVPLSSLQTARPFLGAVQLVTRTGDKHLMKYLANPADAATRILAAAGPR
jgi:hypothetical protein